MKLRNDAVGGQLIWLQQRGILEEEQVCWLYTHFTGEKAMSPLVDALPCTTLFLMQVRAGLAERKMQQALVEEKAQEQRLRTLAKSSMKPYPSQQASGPSSPGDELN